MAKILQLIFNDYRENCFIAALSENAPAVVVDPGAESPQEITKLEDLLESKGLVPEAVLLTHGHHDHIYGVLALQERYGCKVYMSQADDFLAAESGFAYTPVRDGQTIEVAGFTFKVITTPGHTPGSVCWLDVKGNVLYSGDTLFAGTIGRTDFPYGNYDHLIVSIMDKIMGLDADTDVLPGHGPCSSIGWERTHNPFLQPFNEKDAETGDVEGIEIHG